MPAKFGGFGEECRNGHMLGLAVVVAAAAAVAPSKVFAAKRVVKVVSGSGAKGLCG